MANIDVRKEQNKNIAAPVAREPQWEPFRMMRELMGWDPFREMTPFAAALPTGFMPSFEIKETKEGYTFKADVPGVKQEDLHVTLTGNRLSITGKRDAEKKESTDTFYAYERSYGEFTRSFTLPDGIDGNSVAADLKEGVLTVSVRKVPEAQPKKIAVSTPATKS